MTRLQAVEKLPLAARKNLRDEWQSIQADFEQQLSNAMGTEWKIDIDALTIVPYGADGSWAKDSPGSMIATYVKDAIRYLAEYQQHRDEINKLASAHVLTMDVDEDGIFDSCGAKFLTNGKLAIVFGFDRLGANSSDAFWLKNLEKGISLAPTQDPLSFHARRSIRDDYDPYTTNLQSQLKGILGRDITLVPNFEDIYCKLKPVKDGSDFDQYIGQFVRLYFEGLVDELKTQKFDNDDMLKEALNEAADKGEVHFRVIDSIAADYGEVAIEDGILFLQTSPDKYGRNIEYCANNIMEIL